MFLAVLPSPSSQGLASFFATFTIFDWCITVVALWSVVRGLMRGLILELFGLAGLIVGITVASWNYTAVARWLSRWITQPSSASIAAFLLLAAAVTLAVLLLGRLVRSAARLVGLGLLDRLAGAIFGFARAALLAAAVLLACTAFLPPQPWIQHSRLAPPLLRVSQTLSFLAPVDLQQRILVGLAQFRHVIPAIP